MKQECSSFRIEKKKHYKRKNLALGLVLGTSLILSTAGFKVMPKANEAGTENRNAELANDTLLGVAHQTFSGEWEEEPKAMSWTTDEAANFEEQTLEQQVEQEAKTKKKTARKKEKIQLSKKDRAVLLRIVEAEATGEDIKGRMLVANVVLNRVKCKVQFPNNVTDVVFDHTGGVCQFSPIDDGRYWKVKISKKTQEAVHRVLMGEDDSKGALYFMARKYADPDNVAWFDSDLRYLFTYGTHSFFIE